MNKDDNEYCNTENAFSLKNIYYYASKARIWLHLYIYGHMGNGLAPWPPPLSLNHLSINMWSGAAALNNFNDGGPSPHQKLESCSDCVLSLLCHQNIKFLRLPDNYA
jgi:hypothetical protein